MEFKNLTGKEELSPPRSLDEVKRMIKLHLK